MSDGIGMVRSENEGLAPTVEIELGPLGFGRVRVDGVDISAGVTELFVSARPGDRNLVTTEGDKPRIRISTRVAIHAREFGPGLMVLSENDERALRALGWIPVAEASRHVGGGS